MIENTPYIFQNATSTTSTIPPINPFIVISQFLSNDFVGAIAKLIAFFLGYYGANGIILREKNKYITLLKTKFRDINDNFKKIYNFKLITRMLPMIAIPISFIFGLYFFYYLIFNIINILGDSIASFYIHFLRIGDIDTDSKILLLSTSITIAILTVIPFYMIFVKFSKKYLSYIFAFVQNYQESTYIILILLWTMIGTIIGGYFISFILIYNEITLEMVIPFGFPLQISSAYTYLTIHMNYFYIFEVLIFFVTVLMAYYIFYLYKKVIYYSREHLYFLSNDYTHFLPIITIKTQSGEITGRIKNLHNNKFICLNEKDTTIYIPWEQINIIEIYEN